jgi:hypothetical protein
MSKKAEGTVFIAHAYQTAQYVVPRGGVFLGKWLNSFAGNSEGKINVQSACALNTRCNTHFATDEGRDLGRNRGRRHESS